MANVSGIVNAWLETGTMRAKARELQQRARRLPLTRAPEPGTHQENFARINRELTWGLTLNK